MATPNGDQTTEADPIPEVDTSSKKDSTEVRALDSFFPETPTHKSYSDIVAISGILYQNGYLGWALCPKFYIIFRVLELLHGLNAVIEYGVSDRWIPMHPGCLRSAGLLDATKAAAFFQAQKLVLATRQLSLGNWPYRGNICCDEQTQGLLTFLRRISMDERGTFDIVQDRVTGKVVTRRLVLRHSLHRSRTYFEDELLSRINHRHVLDYIGCLATIDSVSFLYAPAAELNLSDFMLGRQKDPKSMSQVQGWIGCLASAILYLHNNSICHGNIKPTSIIIDGENIVLAGFSQSVSCISEPKLYQNFRAIGLSWDYTFVDVWALGGLYVQMLSFICGQHPQSVHTPPSPSPYRVPGPNMSADRLSLKDSLKTLHKRSTRQMSWDVFQLAEQILTSSLAAQSTAIQIASGLQTVLDTEPEWCHRCCHNSLGNDSNQLKPRKISNTQGPFTDQEIELYSRELGFIQAFQWENQPFDWWSNPRVYITFDLMERRDLLPASVEAGVTDIWIPFEEKLLKKIFLDPSVRRSFLEHQESVLNLTMEPGKHQHFLDGDKHLEEGDKLGSGGFASVSRCKDRRNNRDVARKLMQRTRVPGSDSAKETAKMFEKELEILQRVTSEEYHHFVSMVGSYTDQHNFAILFTPVADTNLADYLQSSPDRQHVKRWFGCLASAVNKLHSMEIKHKDIKPKNCLILRNNVLLTDFGISRDAIATTSGRTFLDIRYCAPEVYEQEKRNESADIWSLGCVYLEMYSVLKGKTAADIRSYFTKNGSKSDRYFRNDTAILSWLDFLEVESTELKDLSSLIRSMLSVDRHKRMKAAELVCSLADRCSYEHDLSTMFCNRCISEMKKPTLSPSMPAWEYWGQIYSGKEAA